MRNRGFRTYKFGNITINVFSNEVVFIYVGQGQAYIKNFMISRLKLFSKLAIASLVAIITVSIPFFTFGENSDNSASSKPIAKELKPVVAVAHDKEALHHDVFEKQLLHEEKSQKELTPEIQGNIAQMKEDEKAKNKLLRSAHTDYSKPALTQTLKIRRHTVKRGENLSLIARKYGVSIGTICGSNNLKSYDLIHEGTKLRIPNKDGILYKMRRGSNLIALSKKYKIPVKKILAHNSFANPDFIPVDATVFIPDAKPQNIVPGFLWPTRGHRITSAFGWRSSPFNRSYKQFHRGLDIAARYEMLRATKYGKVTFTGWLGGYGKAVIIAHPNGWKSLYGHLSRIIVRRGQYVKQGQYIARSGNTGRSTGPHLHFELIKNGKNKNPRKYLKR